MKCWPKVLIGLWTPRRQTFSMHPCTPVAMPTQSTAGQTSPGEQPCVCILDDLPNGALTSPWRADSLEVTCPQPKSAWENSLLRYCQSSLTVRKRPCQVLERKLSLDSLLNGSSCRRTNPSKLSCFEIMVEHLKLKNEQLGLSFGGFMALEALVPLKCQTCYSKQR